MSTDIGSSPGLPYLDKLDARQKAAATAEKNSVVTAGAGAGKTTALAARYIHLVMEKQIPVRSILALTFTRKAAAEMYERIYGELAKITSPWALEQLADFSNAHITTIDSFCTEITRQAARDYGYSPDFAIDEEKSGDIARKIAHKYVIRNREKPGLVELLRSYPFDSVVADFFGDIGAKHVTPEALFGPVFSPMEKTMQGSFAAKTEGLFRSIIDKTQNIEALSLEARGPKADCRAAIDGAHDLSLAYRAGDETIFPVSRFARHMESLAGLALRAYGKNEAEQSIKALARELREDAAKMLDLVEFEQFFPTYRALLQRLDEFAGDVAEAKRLADVMDFKDLGRCAVAILKNRKDIRAFWKKNIKSIMIDEFQDNNELQKNLLYLLAERLNRESGDIPGPAELEEGKLFFVGDEKQSIYRFRGADVSVFKRLAKELSWNGAKEQDGELVLSTNYRSSEALIGFFNDLFPLVMGEAGHDGGATDYDGGAEGQDFSARYSVMEPGPHPSQKRSFDSIISYYLVEPAKEEDLHEQEDEENADEDSVDVPDAEFLGPDDSLAFEIAQFIGNAAGTMEIQEETAGSASGANSRKAEYGDFAVLLRTASNQHRLEKYFRLLDIPFDSESPRSLFRESPAHDMYNILSLLLDPADKAAYAAVLRSPLCRISDEAFVRLLASQAGIFEYPPDAALSDYDRQMLDRAKAFFGTLGDMAGGASVPEIVTFVWNYAGLRLEFLSKPEALPYLEHFDYLFHIAAKIDQQQGGIVDFIEHIRPYIDGSIDKYEIENVPRNAVSGVKLLTIHKSKGLQFPIVIIPWVENIGSNKRNQPLWHMLPEGLTVDIKPFDKPGARANNIFFKLASDLENQKNNAETRRLFYVACTRAKDHLIFFGKTPKRKDAAGKSFQSFLEGYVEKTESRCGDGIQPRSKMDKIVLPCRKNEDVRHWYKNRVRPSFGDFLKAYRDAGILQHSSARRYVSATELNEEALRHPEIRNGEAGLPSGLAEGRSQEPQGLSSEDIAIPPDRFGSLCHDAVEYAISNKTMDDYSPPPSLMRGLDPPKAAPAIRLAGHYAENFLDSAFWRSIPAEADVKSEKPFILKLGEQIVEGRMDLSIETAGEIIIVDFKTDMEENPRHYAVQMELYRKAAEGFVSGKKIRTGLFWLRNSRLTWCDREVPETYLVELARRVSGHLEPMQA